MEKNIKIALFGGTFDPIHYGHLVIAEQIRSVYNFDEIWFCPNYISPRRKKTFFSAKERLYFIQIACEQNPFFKVLDFEIQRKGISYTIDTINEIYKKKPLKKPLHLIVSQDLYQDLPNWKSYDEIKRKIIFTTFDRYQKNENLTVFPISSSMIRALIKEKKSIRYLVPEGIENFLRL